MTLEEALEAVKKEPPPPPAPSCCGLCEMLKLISAQGRWVNNLFQLSPDRWRASLRDETLGYEFGEGPTPLWALWEACQKWDGKEFQQHEVRVSTLPMGRLKKADLAITLEDIGL